MLNQAYTLFLSPRGRIGRQAFIVGVLLWGAFYTAQYFWFKNTGTNTPNFYLSLIFLVINIQIVFCIFGKRLHDLGRSTWPLIGTFMLVFVAAIIVMLNFGGLEYFDALMANPELQNDPEAMKQLHQTYQDTLAQNIPQSRALMSIIPVLFTLWLAVTKGQSEANRYGNPLQSGE